MILKKFVNVPESRESSNEYYCLLSSQSPSKEAYWKGLTNYTQNPLRTIGWNLSPILVDATWQKRDTAAILYTFITVFNSDKGVWWPDKHFNSFLLDHWFTSEQRNRSDKGCFFVYYWIIALSQLNSDFDEKLQIASSVVRGLSFSCRITYTFRNNTFHVPWRHIIGKSARIIWLCHRILLIRFLVKKVSDGKLQHSMSNECDRLIDESR